MGLPHLIRRCVVAAACAVALAAPTAAQERPRHPWTVPHVLRYATAEDIVGLNPHINQQLTVTLLSSLTMAHLLRYDRTNHPVPELATSVPSLANGGISADGKAITYHLRRDAKWSDGVPFTADDVRFSIDVVRNPANIEGTHLGFDLVTRVDTPDASTVVIHLRKPYSGFYVNFFGSGGGVPCILPKHLLGALPSINEAPYNALPVGIGPFKYVSWKRGDSVEVVRDPLYFGRKPKLERIIFKIVPDRNTVLTQLTTHEIDLWLPVPAAYFDRVRDLPNIRTLRQASYAYNHIDFELDHGALRDPAVRRALRLGIDRAAILNKVRHGVGILAETLFSPGHPFHIDEPRVPYDPVGANRLLDRDGWKLGADGVRSKAGQRLDFAFATGAGAQDTDAMLELIRVNWNAIGVRFDVKHYPSPLLFAPFADGGILYAGKYDLAAYAWFTAPNGDVSNLFACDRFPPHGQNIPHYCDRDVDRAMDRFLTSYDGATQFSAARLIQQRIARDVPTIVLDQREDVYAFNDDLRDFHPNQVTAFDDLVDADI